jgi:hypothetical protein
MGFGGSALLRKTHMSSTVNWAVYGIEVTVFCDCGYVLSLVENDLEVVCPECEIVYRPTVVLDVSRNETENNE